MKKQELYNKVIAYFQEAMPVAEKEANSNPVSKNILLFAKTLHLFGIRRLKRNLFFRESRKIFLKKLFISKTSPHLFPLGEGIWG